MDFEPSPHLIGSMPHDLQTDACRRSAIQGDSPPGVRNLKDTAITALGKTDSNRLCLAMPKGVLNGFLNNSVEMHRDFAGTQFDLPLQFK